MSNPAEERFLAARMAREEARAASASESDAARARVELVETVQRFVADFSALIDANYDDAVAKLKEFQVFVNDASQTVALTAHDIKTVNASLAEAVALMEAKVPKAGKFSFSKKNRGAAKTAAEASSSVAVASNGETADKVDATTANQVTDLSAETRVLESNQTAAFIRRCRDCVIFVPPVNGSAFVTECTNCVIFVACHQMRILNCSQCEFYVWCRSIPVIEKSTELRFGEYTAWSNVEAHLGEGLEGAVQKAGIADIAFAKAVHTQVADFSWIKQQTSPNWTALPSAEWTRRESPLPAASPALAS